MSTPEYVLGSDEAEIARLETQAAALAEPTALLLKRGGIVAGMRVLDLGTGPGDVAFQLAELVGPEGSVTGVDRDPAQLSAAEDRRERAGLANVTFRRDDARTFVDAEPFDAVVCRLLLFHLPDAVDVIAHHARGLVPSGRFLAVDYDMGAVRALPPVELLDRVREWLNAGFAHAKADPFVGMRLPVLFAKAGLQDIGSLGVQPYWPPNHPSAPSLATDVVRALAPAIVASGIATEEELGLDTLEQRVREAINAAGAVWTSPTVVGCWGRRA
jgi:SAM-dependent methyltransferase